MDVEELAARVNALTSAPWQYFEQAFDSLTAENANLKGEVDALRAEAAGLRARARPAPSGLGMALYYRQGRPLWLPAIACLAWVLVFVALAIGAAPEWTRVPEG